MGNGKKNWQLEQWALGLITKRDKDLRKKMNITKPIHDDRLVLDHVAEANEFEEKVTAWYWEREDRRWAEEWRKKEEEKKAEKEAKEQEMGIPEAVLPEVGIPEAEVPEMEVPEVENQEVEVQKVETPPLPAKRSRQPKKLFALVPN